MRRVYSTADLQEAYLLKGLLFHAGIVVEIKNEHAQGAVGEIPFVEVFPELWVVDDSNESVALQCIEEYRCRRELLGELHCENCSEINPASFELCWKCGGDLQ